MTVDIVAMGEPMLEFNAEDQGSLSEVGRFVVGWGGDTSNFAIAAARAGAKVGFVTRLGADEFGDSFIKLWQREGIDSSRVERDPDAPTGIYFISRRGKEHFFTYYRAGSAASRMTPAQAPLDYVRRARLLHVSGISQAISASASDAVLAALEAARQEGVLVSYDPNLRLKLWPLSRAKAVIHQAMAMADLAFPSLEDARSLTGLKDPEEIARFYLDLGPKVVVVKLGAEGALLATGDAMRRYPPRKVDTVDQSGAGDTFDGAFCAAWLEGRSPGECALFANAAAALTTTGLGCVTPVPYRDRILQLMTREDQ